MGKCRSDEQKSDTRPLQGGSFGNRQRSPTVIRYFAAVNPAELHEDN